MKKIRGGLYEYKGYEIEKLDRRAGWGDGDADYNLWVFWWGNSYGMNRSDYGYKTMTDAKNAIDEIISERNHD